MSTFGAINSNTESSKYQYPTNIANAHLLACENTRYLLMSAAAFDISIRKQSSPKLRELIESIVGYFKENFQIGWGQIVKDLQSYHVHPSTCLDRYPALWGELVYLACDISPKKKILLLESSILQLRYRYRYRIEMYIYRLKHLLFEQGDLTLLSYCVGMQLYDEMMKDYRRSEGNIHITPWHGVSAGHGADLLHAVAYVLGSTKIYPKPLVYYWVETDLSINGELETHIARIFSFVRIVSTNNLEINDPLLIEAYQSDSIFNMLNPFNSDIVSDLTSTLQMSFRRSFHGLASNTGSRIVAINIRTEDFKPSNAYEQSIRNTSLTAVDKLYRMLKERMKPIFLTAGSAVSFTDYSHFCVKTSNDAMNQYFLVSRSNIMIASSTGLGHLWSIGAEKLLVINAMSLWTRYALPKVNLISSKTIHIRDSRRLSELTIPQVINLILTDWVSPVHRSLFYFEESSEDDHVDAFRDMQAVVAGTHPYTLQNILESYQFNNIPAKPCYLSRATYKMIRRIIERVDFA